MCVYVCASTALSLPHTGVLCRGEPLGPYASSWKVPAPTCRVRHSWSGRYETCSHCPRALVPHCMAHVHFSSSTTLLSPSFHSPPFPPFTFPPFTFPSLPSPPPPVLNHPVSGTVADMSAETAEKSGLKLGDPVFALVGGGGYAGARNCTKASQWQHFPHLHPSPPHLHPSPPHLHPLTPSPAPPHPLTCTPHPLTCTPSPPHLHSIHAPVEFCRAPYQTVLKIPSGVSMEEAAGVGEWHKTVHSTCAHVIIM